MLTVALKQQGYSENWLHSRKHTFPIRICCHTAIPETGTVRLTTLPALLWKAELFLHSSGCRRAQRPLPITRLISVPPESELLEKEVVEGNFTLKGTIWAKCQQAFKRQRKTPNAMQMCLTTGAHTHAGVCVCVFVGFSECNTVPNGS